MKEFLGNQYKNAFLWAPIMVAFGAALYFSLDNEPFFNFPILITLLLAGVIYRCKNILIRAIAIFAFGFFYAAAFTNIINTPQIHDSFGEIEISGTIKDIDFTPDSNRILLHVPLYQISPEVSDEQFTNIRISLMNTNDDLNVGDTISGNAIIFHPSPKYAPESFDFARWAYFSKISATGFFKDYKITQSNKDKNNLRMLVHKHAKSYLTDALVIGYKKSIPKNESHIWQSVGLGHIWSISGFHFTLLGGWLFALFYFIFRLIAPITKRIPAKYPAMLGAWCGLLFYLFISGVNIATVRAFIMATLIFIATIFGRGVLSLRNVALAFFIIFLINPYYVMQPGFQLSFAAIFGLIWYFNDKKYIKRNTLRKLGYLFYMSLMTAVIATMFTLPFIISSFGFIPLYSLFGNVLLLPIFSFAIMPLVIIGTIFVLFGNHFLLDIANEIYLFSLNIAQHISNMPYANITMPHISNMVLILFIVGMMCIVLIVKKDVKNFWHKNINYLVGGGFILIGIIIYITSPKPLFYATDDNKLVGFVVDNKIKFNKSKSSKHFFAFDTWRQFNNETSTDKNEKYKCVKGLCVYETPKWNLVYMQNFTTIMDNLEKICDDKNINYIVSSFDITPQNCHAKILSDGIFIYPSGRIRNFSNHRRWHNMQQQNTDQTQAH